MADGKRIVTKVEYDTTGVAQGLAAGKAALTSFGESATGTAEKGRQSVSSLEREYKRLAAAIDPAEKAQQKYARAQQITSQLVERGRLTQEQANETLRKAEAHYNSNASQVGKLAGAVTALTSSYAVMQGLRLAEWAIGISGQYETLRHQLGAVLESQANANVVFAELQRIDSTKIEEMAGAYVRLANAGLRPTITEMRSFADMAAGTGTNIQSLSDAIVAATSGSGRGLRQFGIFFKDLGDTASITFRGMTQVVENNSAAIFEAVEHIGRTNFAGQLEAKAKTAAGALDELRDSGEEAADAFIRGGLGDEIGKLSKALTEMASHGEVIGFLSDISGWLVQIARFSVSDVSGLKVLSGLANTFGEGGAFGPSAAEMVARSNKEIEGRKRLIETEKELGAERERQAKQTKAANDALEDQKRLAKEHQQELKRAAEEAKRLAEQLAAMRAEQAENVQHQGALLELWKQTDRPVRDLLEGERRLNDQHQDRLSFLKLERQFGEQVARGLVQQAVEARKLKEEMEEAKSFAQDLAKALEGAKLEPIDIKLDASKVPMFSAMEVTFDNEKTIDEWNEFGQAIHDGLRTASDNAELYMAQVREAVDKGFLSAADGEKELARVRAEQADAITQRYMSATVELVSFIGNAFGGGAQKIAGYVQQIQAAYQSGSSIGGKLGGTQQAAAAGGVAGAIVGIWVAAYDWFTSKTKQDRMRSYGYAATAVMEPGYSWASPALTGQARQASLQIQQTLDALMQVLGGAITSFADMEIQVRRDGEFFRAYVEGVFLGSFKSMDEALSAALLRAFSSTETTVAGLTGLVRRVFENFREAGGSAYQSMEELQSALEFARRLDLQNLPDSIRRMAEETSQAVADFRRAAQLYGNDLPALQMAADSILTRLTTSLTSLYNELMGIKEDPKAAWERMKAAYNAQRAITIAQITLLYEEIKARIALYQAQRLTIAGFTGGGGGYGQGTPGGDRRLEPGPDRSQGASKGGGFGDRAPDIRNPQNDPQLAALLEVLDNLARVLAGGIPPEITGDMPRGFGRGGRGGARQQARDWLDDNAFRLAAERMGSVQRQLAEMNRTYDEQAKQLKAGSAEMQRLNAQRAEEAKLIRQRAVEAGYQGLKSYESGGDPFAAERQRAADLKKQFDDLLKSGAIGQQRYQQAMGRVNAALERHLELLRQQEAASLFGDLAGLLDQAGLADSAEKAQLLAEQQRANFVLQLAEAQLRFQQLVAEGALIGKNKEMVEAALRKLQGIDPNTLFNPDNAGESFEEWQARARSDMAKAMDDARKLREKYEEDTQDALSKRLHQIQEDFRIIFEVLGRGAENMALFRKAVDDAFAEIRQPVQEFLDSLGLSEQSTLTGQQKLDLASQQFDAITARIAKGDFSAYGEFSGSASKLLELAAGQYGTAGPAYKKLYDRIVAMGNQAVSLTGAAANNFVNTGQIGYGNVSPMTLATAPIVDAIASGNASAKDSARSLAEIRMITEAQAGTIGVMAQDIASLRAANESLARELSMMRNQR